METALRVVRKGTGLSQCQLAAKARIAQATISELENGRRDPRLKVARQLARALETPIDDLFPDEEDAATAAAT